jgi:hypothetical protein
MLLNRGVQLLLAGGPFCVRWRAEADCKQLAGSLQNAKAEASVKRLGGGVVTSHLDMKCSNALPFAFSEQRLKCRSPQTLPPMARTNVKIVDERILGAVFHAVSKGKHDITGGIGIVENDPDGTLGVVTQERAEAVGSPLTIQQELRLCVELPHERYEKRHVLTGGAAYCDHSIAADLHQARLLDGGADERGE